MTQFNGESGSASGNPELDDDTRRAFFRRYAGLATVTPAITLLLATSLASPAIAASGGGGGGGGGHHHHHSE